MIKRQTPGTVELGIRQQRVFSGDHIALLWETKEEFEEAAGFLQTGLEKGEHVVIFGHPEANPKHIPLAELLRG